ncbi:hypothetical protein HERIO_1244 [Hepatospora eriocheir]|uniref:Homeodomain-like domain-containing protein n=1 Tax=Hepatospora eriocheir TaxID=1081669 RepID=A0A1X0QAQ4_9MICR|nr:hypothetical protein HERIO_1244 [Hepatospora eriocheir]
MTKHLSERRKVLIEEYIKSGLNQTQISKKRNISRNTVQRYILKLNDGSFYEIKKGSGRKKLLQPNHKMFLVKEHAKDHFVTLSFLQKIIR